MWILSSDGDFLQGKRLWLKPGQKYLFGRVKREDVRHAIDHPTISRQHLVIEVRPVKSGDGSHVHTRSTIVVTDQNTKCGTVVDGESIKGQSKELNREEHKIKLGKYPSAFRIKWCPVVLTFSFASKGIQEKVASVRSRLEDLDIKTVVPYISNKTTHVVQSKRNTAKGLQALINGGYIVDDSYVEAVVYAATPGSLVNQETLSPLEADFDAAWPDPLAHLPPRGKEPTERPDSAYQPNFDRQYVFEGYTFIICDGRQFEDLQGVITSGHGKALICEVEQGKTTADEIVDFMKKAAGTKGLGAKDTDGGVLLVKFRATKGHEAWTTEILSKIPQLTGQQIVDAGEFLDAVLRNDASCLLRPAERQVDLPAPPSAPAEPQSQVSTGGDLADSQPVASNQDVPRPAKRSRTRTFVSKLKTFDDGFDMDSIPEYTFPQADADGDIPLGDTGTSEQPPPDQAPSAEDDVVTDLLPGAAAMKLRDTGNGRKRRGDSVQAAEQPPKPKKPKLNVIEAARQRREAEDEAARERRQNEAASLQAIAESMGVDRLQNLAIVEEMPLRRKDENASMTSNGTGRWDERWNGRKNFKKFRRKGGEGGGSQFRSQPVIVPLEEAKRQDFGIGDVYWKSERSTSQPRQSQKQSQRQSQQSSQRQSQSRSQPQPQPQRVVDQLMENIPPPSDEEEEQQQQLPAPEKPPTPPRRVPNKRRRDSDSDDGTRFRFRRRREG